MELFSGFKLFLGLLNKTFYFEVIGNSHEVIRNIVLAKKKFFFFFLCWMLLKNPNELLGQLNNTERFPVLFLQFLLKVDLANP